MRPQTVCPPKELAQASPVDDKILMRLYREMLRLRKIEEVIAEFYPEQQMRGPVHLCIGQEAISVGVSAHLKKEDSVFSGHRAHGHYLAKGGNLQLMMDEIYGKATGCAGGRGGSMHLIDLEAGFCGSTPIVGGTLPVALGYAHAAKIRCDNSITVCYLGEACTEEGIFHECLNFASLHQIPIIYVIENNFFSVYTPLDQRQPNRSLGGYGIAHNIPSATADGNDVEAVYNVMGPVIERARAGGPQIAYFDTYRWREHCGPNYDNNIGYRTEEEFLQWKEHCPLRICERKMESRGYLSPEEKEQLEAEYYQESINAINKAKRAPFQDSSLNTKDSYE